MGTIVDRKGKEDALEGFRFFMRDATAEEPSYFSIWSSGGRLKFASKEADPDAAEQEFSDILDVWERNATSGVLEVRFHEQVPSKAITNKAPYSGSFTFKMSEYGDTRRQSEYGAPVPVAAAHRNPIAEAVALMKSMQEFQALAAPPASDIGAIGNETVPLWKQLIDEPVIQELVIGFANKMGLDIPQQPVGMAGDATAEETEEETHVASIMFMEDEQQEQRLFSVLERLKKDEKDFLGLLEKLANIKEKNPSKYNMAKMML